MDEKLKITFQLKTDDEVKRTKMKRDFDKLIDLNAALSIIEEHCRNENCCEECMLFEICDAEFVSAPEKWDTKQSKYSWMSDLDDQF